ARTARAGSSSEAIGRFVGVFLWFVATSILAVRYVFRDPRFDYRLLIVGALLPDAVDVVFGGARVLHTLTASVALLTLIMVATKRGSTRRRRLLPFAIGFFMHLVFDGAFANTDVFWWPFTGTSFEGARLPVAERGALNLLLEVVGAAGVAWIVRRHGLTNRDARRRFLATGELVEVG
ncbi:MAG: hypothetical protein ACKO3L_07690, partial [Actinomycetota bacterium]